MRTWVRWMLPLLCLQWAAAAGAQGTAHDWVLTLGWSPEYCNDHLGSKEMQCTEEHYFELDSLRPDPAQTDCPSDDKVTAERLDHLLYVIPNRARLKAVWRQHGSCSGLGIDEYFVQLDRAKRRVQIPPAYRDVPDVLKITSAELKNALVASNPGLRETGISLECRGSWLREVRVCLDQDFGFRDCGLDVVEDCKPDIRLRALRASRRLRKPKG